MRGAPARRRCIGAVLAGGAATRFGGRAKGLEPVGGRRIVDRVAEALAASADAVLLVAADQLDAGDWRPGTRVVRDVRRGCGSLGGLHAALVHAGGDDVLVVSWDMPFVPGALLGALRETGQRTGARAVLPASAAPGGGEPLCAWYAADALGVVEQLLDAGERRVGAVAAALGAPHLAAREVARLGGPVTMFLNVNTTADLQRAVALASRAARAPAPP